MIAEARKLVEGGKWSRAGAVLARQVLEEQLEAVLGPDVCRCSARARFLVLEEKLGRGVARELAYVYGRLSGVCHYHPYDLGPTREELLGWIDVVERAGAVG